MKQVESAELSAYLDGEVSPARKTEIEAALQHDAALCAQFEELKALHLNWQASARSLMFFPTISLPASHGFLQSPVLMVCVVLMLLVLRFAPKFTDILLLAVVLHVAALSLILPWVVRMVRHDAGKGFSVTG